MSIIKRIQNLEKHFGAEVDPGTEAAIIFTEDHSKDAGPPQPVTRFSFSGHEIHRHPDELYPAFEIRAIREALEHLPQKQPGRAAPVPVLIADGSLEQ